MCRILIGLLALTPAILNAAELRRGPYLQLATPESMVVVWQTVGATQPVLKYGKSPNELNHTVESKQVLERVSADVAAEADMPYGSVPLLYDEPIGIAAERDPRDPSPSTKPGVRQYEASIKGLDPGKKYYYAVFDGETRLAGGDAEHFFKTSPANGSSSNLRAWVVGDSGTGGLDQKRVFTAMQKFSATSRNPDIFLHLGDMAYGDGADHEFQQNFFDIYQTTLRNTVCWPAMGNHEGHTSRGISQFGPYYDAYVLPQAAEAGGVASGTEAYYSFDIGDAHFICLDSHDLDRSPSGAMARWLAIDLEEIDSNWLIAFWHHPPYTKGSHDSDRESQLIEMREYIMPLLESGGVDLVLAGHSHIYERSMLIDGAYATPTVAEDVVFDDGDGRPDGDGPYRKSRGVHPNEGTVAIVAGHGGANVSRKGTMPIMREIVLENGSLILDIAGDTLDGIMIDKRGEIRDHFQLQKKGQVTPRRIESPWQPRHDPSQITEITVVWTEEEAGKSPKNWTLHGEGQGTMLIQQRTGTPYYQANLKAQRKPLLCTYDEVNAKLSEAEAYLEFVESTAAAGLVIGFSNSKSYYTFLLDPIKRSASLVLTEGQDSRVLTSRELEIDFSQPIKIELEPVMDIMEVQVNDQLEYTVKLEQPLEVGRVGVLVRPGGQVNFAGLSLEKSR